MEKPHNKAINVAQALTPAISSRDVAKRLKPLIVQADTQSVDLDFQDVQVISRSVAHELLTMKEELASKKKLVFTNLNKDVKEMLRITAANRIAPAHDVPRFNPQRISINALMKEHVLI